ncbi:MAG: AMP-binding protein, partial [Gammaproteobacteria bacterium]|nr:AMP-binding protein [Gammaproteobacteria bacterium]
MQLIDPTSTDFDAIRRRFRWRVPEYYNMAWEVCDRHANLRDTPALYYENVDGERRTFTFGHLYSDSNRLANALAALGVGRGDRVGIVLPQRFETGVAHIALYKLGAIAMPLSVLFGSDALEYRMRDSGATAVFSVNPHTEYLMDIKHTLPGLQTVIGCDGGGDCEFHALLDRASDAFTAVRTRADDPALLIYTSGTTGPPKGAQMAHRALLGNLPGFELSQNFFPHPGDVFWTPADWAWTGGLLDALLPAWAYGRPIVAFEGRSRFDPERACALVQRYRVSNAFVPPTVLKMLRQVANLNRFELRFRAIMSAGEQMGAEVFQWGKESLGLEINEMWGQTEFNYLVGNCAQIMPVVPGSMGKPYPGHDVEPIDDHGRPQPVGEVGELAARTGDP